MGTEICNLAERLFPICRSITGNGVRKTLGILKEIVPRMKIYEVLSGTKVFDWIIPEEWNISNGYIADLNGRKIIDFKENNLHVVSYSIPTNKTVMRDELLEHIYTLPEQPEVVQYVTSYVSVKPYPCFDSKRPIIKPLSDLENY